MPIYYNPKLKELARQLRKNSTLSEVLLWQQLKGQQIQGADFHRQKPVDEYILDFFCYELMLAIEIDGCSHEEKIDYDMKRQRRLETLGITVLRFLDTDVKQNLAGVLKAIEEWIVENKDGERHTPPCGHPSS